MKKLLFFPLCLMIAFASCKKSDKNGPAASNTITATVDGNAVNFNNGVTGLLSNTQGEYVLLVSGVTGLGSSEQSIQVGIDSHKPITTGTYTLSSSTSPDATAIPLLAYGLGTGSAGDFVTDINGTDVTTVTITSINDTNVQGTFNGVLVSAIGNGTKKSITSGKFNVAITKQQ